MRNSSTATDSTEFFHGLTIDLKRLPKKSVFTSLKFGELVDTAVASKILNEKKEDWKYIVPHTNRAIYPSIEEAKTVFKHKKGVHAVKYSQRCGKLGRYYGHSVVVLPKKIKHTMMKSCGYIDVDMVKAHPTILSQCVKQIGIPTPCLDLYLEDPQKQFSEMKEYYGSELTDGKAKTLYNLALYGGTHKSWVEKLTNPPEKERKRGVKPINLLNNNPRPFEVQFINEVRTLSENIRKCNPALHEHLMKHNEKYPSKDDHRKNGTVTSFFLQSIENFILEKAVEYLIDNDYVEKRDEVNIVSGEFDGCCFPPTRDVEGLEQLINEHVKDTVGIDIKWKIKGFDNVYNDIIEPVDDNSIDSILADDDLTDFEKMVQIVVIKATEQGYKRLNGNIVKKHPCIKYVYTPVWTNEKRKQKYPVKQFISDCLVDTGIFNLKAKNFKDITQWGLTTDHSEFSIVHSPSRELVGFNNGIFSLDTLEFTEWNDIEYKKDPFIVMYDDIDYTDELLECSSVKEWKQVFEYQGFNDEEREFVEIMLGRLLYPVRGYDEWDKVLWIIGASGVGKTTILKPITKLITSSELGIIDGGSSKGFGLSQQLNKMTVLIDDAPANIGANLSRDIYNKIAQGGELTADVKREEQLQGEWTPPVVVTSNYKPNFSEKVDDSEDSASGAVRRTFPVMFDRIVNKSDYNIEKAITSNFMKIALSCAYRYRKVAKETDHIDDVMCDKFKDIHEETFANDDPIKNFIDDNEEYDFRGNAEDYTELKVFTKMYHEHTNKKWVTIAGKVSLQKAGFVVERSNVCKACRQRWNSKTVCSKDNELHSEKFKKSKRTTCDRIQFMKIADKTACQI